MDNDFKAARKLASDDFQPVHSALYRAGPTVGQFGAVKIDRMLKEEIIKPATTRWASLIVFARKKDGSLRFAVDYRKLNAVTVRDS